MARLYALTECGGIYMDTDVEVIKPFDDALLTLHGFTCFQSKSNDVSTGLLGCEKGFHMFEEFLSDYSRMRFCLKDGTAILIPNTRLFTELCVRYGLARDNSKQTVCGLTVFPSEYFSPKNPITKRVEITDHTYSIHHFAGSWFSDIKECELRLHQKYKLLPEKVVNFIAYSKLRGLKAAVRAAKRWAREKKNEQEFG